MKLISWNVNGLRACAGKGFFDFFASEDADFFCLGETKMQPDQASLKHRAIFSTGTVLRKKDIPALPSLQNGNLCRYPMVLASMSTTMKAV